MSQHVSDLLGASGPLPAAHVIQSADGADNLLLNSTPLSLPPKPDQLPLPSPEQPIFDIPAFTPIVPIKLRSKDSTQSLELLDKAAATHRALPTYITEPLAPLAPLEPLEMAYMRGEAGEGLVGCVRTEKKRKYAYDGEGICGEQVKQKAEGKEGKWTAVGDSAAGELQVTAALFKHVGSSYRPHGRAFDILVDKGAENGAVKVCHQVVYMLIMRPRPPFLLPLNLLRPSYSTLIGAPNHRMRTCAPCTLTTRRFCERTVASATT